jgi:hypothetical protein
MSSHLRHHDHQQPYYEPSSSTANFVDDYMQDAANPTNIGPFSGASNVDASSSTFTDVAGHQFNQNIHLHALNVRPPFLYLLRRSLNFCVSTGSWYIIHVY